MVIFWIFYQSHVIQCGFHSSIMESIWWVQKILHGKVSHWPTFVRQTWCGNCSILSNSNTICSLHRLGTYPHKQILVTPETTPASPKLNRVCMKHLCSVYHGLSFLLVLPVDCTGGCFTMVSKWSFLSFLLIWTQSKAIMVQNETNLFLHSSCKTLLQKCHV